MALSPLKLLIRRARLTVDQMRVDLAELNRQQDLAANSLIQHDAHRANEETILQNAEPALHASFPNWLRQHQTRRLALQDRHDKLRRSCDGALEALQDAVGELKRFELAEAAEETARKQQAERATELKTEEVEMIRRSMDERNR